MNYQMADGTATKQHHHHHPSINGGGLITEFKTLSYVVKNRRTVAFAYGFMFAFVLFTVFLAFNPSPNTYPPWFSNIFTSSSSADSYRSIFSYFSSDASTSTEQVQNYTRSRTLDPFTLQNQTQNVPDSLNPAALHANLSTDASVVNEIAPGSNNFTQNTVNSTIDQGLKPNQTEIQEPMSPVIPNSQANLSINSVSPNLEKRGGGVEVKKMKEERKKNAEPNYTASLTKKQSNISKQSNGSNPEILGEHGFDRVVQNMVNCDLFDGEWVKDDSYPLYKPGSCSLIGEQFNCILNGRPDKDYQKYKWKPKGCAIPRLNPAHMLDMLKGKRLVFVGDSLNRNMWESLVCMLKGSVKDQSKVFEANGRQYFRGEASYSFIFKDYNCTIEFFVSPFLVQEWEMPDKNGSKKETLRLDLVGRFSDQYEMADIIVFNTGHWWTHEKTSKGKDYYQEGSHVYDELNVLEAFRKALTTWARWVDANVNPMKSLVFFRGYSASHFSGGQWNSGGACDNEVEPIQNATYLQEYPFKMLVLEKVLRGMKTHVTYMNVTRMTDFRKDGHPSIYRKQNVPAEERKSPLLYQDCSHWCLPGVPDTWNEILYAELLVNEYQNRKAQKKHG